MEHGKDQQSDWPKGTVRRATRELEQKIKQEVSSVALVSSAPACPSRCSPVNTSSRKKTEETSSHTHLTPDPSTVSTHHHQPQNNMDKVEKDESFSANEDRMGRESERQLREGERMNTALTHSLQSHSISSSSSLAMVLQLEGITKQESYTDSDCLPGRYPKDMRETWETLKELGAFLWQVSGYLDRRLSQPWSRREQRKGRAARDRTKEVETRIRQAGLTPPSMMKRSASLAKLGSLELSPVDLCELDLSPALLSAPTSKPRSQLCSDDTSKKLRVLPIALLLSLPLLPLLFLPLDLINLDTQRMMMRLKRQNIVTVMSCPFHCRSPHPPISVGGEIIHRRQQVMPRCLLLP